ncbi:MAG: ABC transporter ATP-binding protein, partial [Chloroflexi bacterium]|nr:ABC transporter ATP-binding protein [Chloroflexota bacterium]
MTLSLDQLSFVSHGRTVLKSITALIPDNSFVCLVGQNGAGKTTLMRILSGELRATSGRYLVDGSDSSALSQREISRRIVIIPQGVQPPLYLSVFELAQL